MAFSLNKVMLIGSLGKDAETRFTTDNKSVTNFSIATENSYKGKDGNWIKETTWHNVVSWNLSDFFKDALKKGAKFYVEGRISKRDYTDKEGVKKYIVEVVSEKLIPLNNDRSGQVQNNEETYTPNVDNNKEEDDLPF